MFQEAAKHVRHYYGDTLRLMFLIAALTYTIAMPLFGHLLPIGIGGGIVLILSLVLLAGFTSPHLKLLMLANVLVSALGVFFMQSAAIELLHSDSTILFVLRQASAVLFLIAFYESVKTLRAMLLGKIGEEPSTNEFRRRQ